MAPGKFLKRFQPKKEKKDRPDPKPGDRSPSRTPPRPAAAATRKAGSTPSASPAPLLSLDIPSASFVTPSPPSSRAANASAGNNGSPSGPYDSVGGRSNFSVGHDVSLDLGDDDEDDSNAPWVDLGRRGNASSAVGGGALSRGALSRSDRARVQRARLPPGQVEQVVRLCGAVIKERGLETLGLMRPWRLAEDQAEIGALQLLLLDWLQPPPRPVGDNRSGEAAGKEADVFKEAKKRVTEEDVKDELVFASVSNVAAVLKWAIRHVTYPSSDAFLAPSSGWYARFSDADRQQSHPATSYDQILAPLIGAEAKGLLDATLDLLAAVSAHVEQNAMPAGRLCRSLGFWLLGASSSGRAYASFEELYAAWDESGRRLEHVFGTWLRAQDKSGSGGLPRRLKELMVRLGKPENGNGRSASSSNVNLPPPTGGGAGKIAALKVVVETGADETTAPPRQQADPEPPTGLKRLGSSGAKSTRKARSSSVATTTSTAPAPAASTRGSSAAPRSPIDTVLAALRADDAAEAAATVAAQTWRALVGAANAGSTADPGSEPTFGREALAKVLADETVRVLELAFPPSRIKVDSVSLTRRESAGKASVGRRRSFSLDSPKGRFSPLGTLYEQDGPPGAAPPSWSEFVSAGFSESSPDLNVNLPGGQAEAGRSAAGGEKEKGGGRSIIPSLGRAGSKTTAAAGGKGLTSPSEETLTTTTAAAANEPATEPKKRSKVVKIDEVAIDETFPDFWLDALGEKTPFGGPGGAGVGVVGRWPMFVVSALQSHVEGTGEGKVLKYLVVEERLANASASAAEAEGEEQQAAEGSTRPTSPAPSASTNEKSRRPGFASSFSRRFSRQKSTKAAPSATKPSEADAVPVAASTPAASTAEVAIPSVGAISVGPITEASETATSSNEAEGAAASPGTAGLPIATSSPVLTPAATPQAVAEEASTRPPEAESTTAVQAEEPAAAQEAEATPGAMASREAVADEAEVNKKAEEGAAAAAKAEAERAEQAGLEAEAREREEAAAARAAAQARLEAERESARKKAEQEAAEAAAAEAARKREEEEAARKREEEEAAKKAEEQARLRAEEEARKQREAEAAAAAAAEEARLAAEREKREAEEAAERERLEAERRAREEAERLEAERIQAERAEAERQEAERKEAERREAERVEAERLEAERKEAERQEAERVEAGRREAERQEEERREAERVEAEKREAERVEAEKREAERVEAERKAAEEREAEQRRLQQEEEDRQAELRKKEEEAAQARQAEDAKKAEQANAEDAHPQPSEEPPAQHEPAAKGDTEESAEAIPADDDADSGTPAPMSGASVDVHATQDEEPQKELPTLPSSEANVSLSAEPPTPSTTSSALSERDPVQFPAVTPGSPRTQRTPSKPPSSASSRKSFFSKAGSRIRSITRSRSKSSNSTKSLPQSGTGAESAPMTPTPSNRTGQHHDAASPPPSNISSPPPSNVSAPPSSNTSAPPSSNASAQTPSASGSTHDSESSDDIRDILAKVRAKRGQSASSAHQNLAPPAADESEPRPSGERTPKGSTFNLNGEAPHQTPSRSSSANSRAVSPSGTAVTAATGSSQVRESFDTARSE